MSDLDRDQQLEFLDRYCEAHLAEDALDELVVDLKTQEASALNNEGAAAQLEYVLSRLGPWEAARTVIELAGRDHTDDQKQLPACFPPPSPAESERSWQVAYRVCQVVAGDQIHVGRITVSAPDRVEAVKRAIRWAHDNDPFCDERIDYYVEAEIEGQESAEDHQDEQDDSAG